MRDFKGHIGRARITSSILIRDLDFNPLFRMYFYGLDAHDLCTVPGGGNYVETALKRRGIDPDSVMFTVWDVGD
jgi:hypothetical protein